MRIVFLGTPDFAVKSLEKIASSNNEVIAVITQLDKPVGRDAKIEFSAVKKCAIKLNIPVLQYENISKEAINDIKNLQPDILVTCAYGQILSKEILEIAKYGVINEHASLLPKYRGAAPIQAAIINGDRETGVTIMKTDVGLDDGDIIAVEKTQINPNETAGELFDRLSEIAANLIVKTLYDIENGIAIYIKQDNLKATKVKQIKKCDALINWSDNYKKIHNFVRGMNPWPIAFTYYNNKILKVFNVEAVNTFFDGLVFGEVVSADKDIGLIVKINGGFLKITELQLEGSKRMSAHDFLLGRKIPVGVKLGK